MKADNVVLWIPPEDISSLPDDVTQLQSHGLQIHGCEELRSYNKLIHALERWPNAYIVTADDDIYYPPNWLSTLVETYKTEGPAIIAWRAHLAIGDKDKGVLPYSGWEYETKKTKSSGKYTAIFPTGVGGVLYPPNSLHSDVSNRDKFLALCPRADDVWFYWMARRQGTRHRRIPSTLPFVSWPSSQDINLWDENVLGGRNDEQIRAIEKVYGPFPLGL